MGCKDMGIREFVPLIFFINADKEISESSLL